MNQDEILSCTPKVLSQHERELYFRNGYLIKKSFIGAEWISRLLTKTQTMIDESRTLTHSNEKFDLEEGHSKNNPKLRRLTQPVQYDPLYWQFVCNSAITDLAEDLLGPNIRFHHSKLNFKWCGGGEEVKWHQDIQFWPHTNFNVLTIGLYLENVDDEMAPMGVIPGSHKKRMFDQYDANNNWTGCLSDEDLKDVALSEAVYLKGPIGSVTVHHCRMIHGSKYNNHSSKSRPLLLNALSSADSLPITPNPTPSLYNGTIIRGEAPAYAQYELYTGRLPPDWSNGYSSIFALQQKE